MTDKQIYQIGLTMINGVGDILARHLLEALGDAEAVFTEKRQSLEKISGIGDSIIAEIKRADVLLRAEKELAFAQKNGISIYFLKDMNYYKEHYEKDLVEYKDKIKMYERICEPESRLIDRNKYLGMNYQNINVENIKKKLKESGFKLA